MVDTRIILSGLWISLMMVYFLGDVLRIFAGDFEPGRVAGTEATPAMWLGMAALMLIPIVMIVLTLTLPFSAARWANIVLPVLLILFNLAGLPYPGAYDNFLIVVSLLFNVVTIGYAWTWVA